MSNNKLIAWVDVLRGPIIYYKRHDDAWIRVHEDDIAPLVRFLRAHYPAQVAEGLRDKEVTE